MNPILDEILRTRNAQAKEGGIPPLEGEFLQRIIKEIKPRTSLEIGLAYGISALFICEALEKVKSEKHIIIDPCQNIPEAGYNGSGLKNLRKAKYDKLVEFIESPSEIALPELLKKGTRVEFAFIDGWHTFDHALVDFFYINRMLNVGGLVAFDDANWPSVQKLCRYVSRFPSYRIFASWAPANSAPRILGSARTVVEDLIALKTRFLKNDIAMAPCRCVAFKKTRTDNRDSGWYQAF
jgi:predicted O-methyltransferase YrrM